MAKSYSCIDGRARCIKQFWKAGEYEGVPQNTRRKIDSSSTCGFDHARMHPRFLHSNATSHKWALGAFAELLDNALDEVRNGATHVNVDVLNNSKDGSRMLLVEDDGGGMDPEKIRKCMSLGYSEKSKIANTIGQYGNGFKTSTMRLGADAIVFSRSARTQSIGLLSYTFLRSTAKEDIVVPMLDYERTRGTTTWSKSIRSSPENWNKNLDTILEWSPFQTEKDLDHQFRMMKEQGTRIIIYNLWEDDEGNLELDFDSEPQDIQMRGVNRDEKSIQMAEQYPNSRHFLTYRHSLKSYAAILYLRLPTNFRIILRGKDVDHHNIVNDLMLPQKITYRPKPLEKEEAYRTRRTRKEKKDINMVAEVTLGFVKDAKNHLDVQGFNVYHKNRLITPFWRVWNSAGSDGRGVIGVIEADYINPAHDKQGFEHTILLDRLKQKLVESQKAYWSNNCHNIGYAPRRNVRFINEGREAVKSGSQRSVSDSTPDKSQRKRPLANSNPHVDKSPRQKSRKVSSDKSPNGNGNLNKSTVHNLPSSAAKISSGKQVIGRSNDKAKKNIDEVVRRPAHMNHISTHEIIHPSPMDEDTQESTPSGTTNSLYSNVNEINKMPSHGKDDLSVGEPRKEEQGNIVADQQCERCKSVEIQLRKKNEEINALIQFFAKERALLDNEENKLKEKLRDRSNTIRELHDQLKEANEKYENLIIVLTEDR